mmetsp:Transcript_11644/g.18462  ORF Transcript_11644/g.18462 Transcript_11644/m.18462 type:complete len:188 (-) Transcript_11644:237-800(-)
MTIHYMQYQTKHDYDQNQHKTHLRISVQTKSSPLFFPVIERAVLLTDLLAERATYLTIPKVPPLPSQPSPSQNRGYCFFSDKLIIIIDKTTTMQSTNRTAAIVPHDHKGLDAKVSAIPVAGGCIIPRKAWPLTPSPTASACTQIIGNPWGLVAPSHSSKSPNPPVGICRHANPTRILNICAKYICRG